MSAVAACALVGVAAGEVVPSEGARVDALNWPAVVCGCGGDVLVVDVVVVVGGSGEAVAAACEMVLAGCVAVCAVVFPCFVMVVCGGSVAVRVFVVVGGEVTVVSGSAIVVSVVVVIAEVVVVGV